MSLGTHIYTELTSTLYKVSAVVLKVHQNVIIVIITWRAVLYWVLTSEWHSLLQWYLIHNGSPQSQWYMTKLNIM